MNFINETIKKISETLQELKSFADSTQAFIDTTSTIITRTYDFLAPIFSFFPWEVLLLLAASIFLMLWINSLFPTTPKWNFTWIIVLLCSAWAYSVSVSSPVAKVPWLQIFQSAMYLLIPVHFLGITNWLIRLGIKSIKKKKQMNPKDLKEFIYNLDQLYHQSSSVAHSILAGEPRYDEFQVRINSLKEFLEKAKLQRKNSLSDSDISR
ncbi:MAG: hypothetical protein O9346_00840 [Leptospiraceae bacterium]|nr:hypothetical protein [Leptospiraceae bacterium]MCZ8344938.1 hypothetical protein [Leptospiraceae bacterium]